MDACGLAGGDFLRQNGAEAGDYKKTIYAQHGDAGTKVLKELPNYVPPTYQIGGTMEVTWQIRNNHGGGYSYRLCKTPDNFTDLTEACFQQNPLDFVQDEQSIVFPDGKTLKLNAVRVPAPCPLLLTRANARTHSLTHSLTHPLPTHSLTHSPTHPLTHSLTHSPTH